MDEPKKVYAVSSGEYSDYHISAVFSTREGAERYLVEFNKANRNGGNIEEWPLDVEAEKVSRQSWGAYISEGGKLEADSPFYDRHELALPQAKSEIREGENWQGRKWLRTKSFISQEHANKVAIEQWQMRLMDGRWQSDWQPPPEPPRPAPSRPVSRPTAAEQAFAKASELTDERSTT